MNRAVMDPAERDREFIAHLAAEGTRLHEAQMMGIGRFAAAHEAGLLGDEPKMLLVAIATGRAYREHALVDAVGRIVVASSCALISRGAAAVAEEELTTGGSAISAPGTRLTSVQTHLPPAWRRLLSACFWQ